MSLIRYFFYVLCCVTNLLFIFPPQFLPTRWWCRGRHSPEWARTSRWRASWRTRTRPRRCRGWWTGSRAPRPRRGASGRGRAAGIRSAASNWACQPSTGTWCSPVTPLTRPSGRPRSTRTCSRSCVSRPGRLNEFEDVHAYMSMHTDIHICVGCMSIYDVMILEMNVKYLYISWIVSEIHFKNYLKGKP